MRRSDGCASCIKLMKAGAIKRLVEAPPLLKASAIVSSICERMIQPARQILAMVGIGRFQLNSFEAPLITAKP